MGEEVKYKPVDLLLIDGPHLLYRAVFTQGDLSYERHGEKHEIGGVYGVLNMLRKVHALVGGLVMVAWEDPDRHIRSYRRDLFPAYKRKDEGEVDYGLMEMRKFAREQEVLLKDVLSLIGCPQATSPEFEADDVIAVVCRQLKDKTIGVLSGDKDLWPLINERVHILKPVTSPAKGKAKPKSTSERHEVIDVGAWRNGHTKFPKGHLVEPKEWSLALAIMGDTADNIPGVDGVGPVNAEKLVVKYGSMDAILEAARNDQIKRFSEPINQMADQLRLNVKLTHLYDDAPLEFITPRRDESQVSKRLREWKFSSMLLGMEFKHLMDMGDGWES